MTATHELGWQGRRLVFALHGVFDAPGWAAWDARIRAAVAQAPAGGWTLLGDLSDFPPQIPEIQENAKAMIAFGTAGGCRKSVLVVPKAVVAMQAKRLVRESDRGQETEFVASRDEADAVLAPVEAAL